MLGLLLLLLALVSVAAGAPSNAVVIDQMMGKVRSMLRREGEEGLTTPQIIGIAVGGGVFVILAGWLIYRYKTWVPKTRPARAGGANSGPSSPSSADERQKLIVAKP
jgi:glucan phosphoethanolaminetransferase (alkaline phosphatase superfamily)